MPPFVWFIAGLATWAVIQSFLQTVVVSRFRSAQAEPEGDDELAVRIREHFQPHDIRDISICEREFPFHVRADLQRALDNILSTSNQTYFTGIHREWTIEGVRLVDCLGTAEAQAASAIPPQYEQIDIGEDVPLNVLKTGLWLLKHQDVPLAMLQAQSGIYGQTQGMRIQIGTPNTPQGQQITQDFFSRIEQAILKSQSYRGKILSLEQDAQSYRGAAVGITVHKLRSVQREQVILPEKTLALLERNVINFVNQRSRLTGLGQSIKKGLLFYGPPGTGKTHTIHYLTRALPGHTTLLISAEQVGLLSQYMTLARLLQPSIVVIEDVDLIARDRTRMNSPCEEVMLNKLLNEMDGLKEDAEIIFILTTNRPDTLEGALASRPGRIDQAIEFPPPDDQGRRKLVTLYAANVHIAEDILADIVKRTAGVSAAFVKEFMRRAVQFHLERDSNQQLTSQDVQQALDEMLLQGGSLNMKLLGAASVCSDGSC